MVVRSGLFTMGCDSFSLLTFAFASSGANVMLIRMRRPTTDTTLSRLRKECTRSAISLCLLHSVCHAVVCDAFVRYDLIYTLSLANAWDIRQMVGVLIAYLVAGEH